MGSPYKNIIAKVFWSQYGLLIVGGTVITTAIAGLWSSFNIYPMLGVVLGVIFRTLLVQTRYVAGFEVEAGTLLIVYITPFFTKRVYHKDLNEVTEIRIDDSNELHVVTLGKWETFDVSTKDIKRDIEQKMYSANLKAG